MEWLATLSEFMQELLTAFILYGCFMLVERLRPAESHQPFSHIKFNLTWFVVYSTINFLFHIIGISEIVAIAQKWFGAPWISLPKPHSFWEYALLSLLFFFATDFFYYWFHRWQHTISFLWGQHKLHHSEQSLNVTSTWRVHWLEDPFLILFLGLPMGLLFGFDERQIALLSSIEIVWLHIIHLNLRLEFGYLSSIVTGPQHHRIHHSFQTEHLDKNFAAFFPILDILFGTYYRPRPNEFPATGLLDGSTHNHLWDAIVLPFREWVGSNYLGRYFKKTH